MTDRGIVVCTVCKYRQKRCPLVRCPGPVFDDTEISLYKRGHPIGIIGFFLFSPKAFSGEMNNRGGKGHLVWKKKKKPD